ncbi:MAG TPA: hypothetical protein VE988_21880, partial [Gemmataceae bacterium]|nr:hypothetical protein [Gemmataceae bacterium]
VNCHLSFFYGAEKRDPKRSFSNGVLHDYCSLKKAQTPSTPIKPAIFVPPGAIMASLTCHLFTIYWGLRSQCDT